MKKIYVINEYVSTDEKRIVEICTTKAKAEKTVREINSFYSPKEKEKKLLGAQVIEFYVKNNLAFETLENLDLEINPQYFLTKSGWENIDEAEKQLLSQWKNKKEI